MKEDFKNEEELTNLLDTYKIDVPTKKLSVKQSPFNRFIRYLGSPAKDPLEKLSDSNNGYLFLKLFPLASGIFLAMIQILFLF
ncbi:hypothetical protein H9635_06290 [Solibacillus sp. A46]|uniref:Uncharacterized protein n=1 Tax=Solibacillus faecavium TaxID=2762221 RepID=A0ABR8XWM0_9BACL|nr:hypothetical protein [Solibacillus faecavium]MBD8036348.1 hypothetical protein [Solibacillus faecavium]